MKPIFTIITPVHNREGFIREAIESIVNQSIGFKKNCELILINDGSTDNSEDICVKYKKKYPDNIKYVYQDNQGVSAARNKGLTLATGEYICFFDSDDVYDRHTLKRAYRKLKKTGAEMLVFGVDLIGSQGEKLDSEYPTTKMFNKIKGDILNTDRDNFFIPTLIGRYVFSSKVIETLSFSNKLTMFEDMLFICLSYEKYKPKIAMDKQVGLHYRRHFRLDVKRSLLANKPIVQKSIWFLLIAIQEFIKTYESDTLPKYIHNLFFYLFNYDKNTIRTYEEFQKISNMLYQVLQHFDDSEIFKTNRITFLVKLKLLELKYGSDWQKKLKLSDDVVKKYKKSPIANVNIPAIGNIYSILEKEKELVIIVSVQNIIPYIKSGGEYIFCYGKKRINAKTIDLPIPNTYSICGAVDNNAIIYYEIKLKKTFLKAKKDLRAFIEYKNETGAIIKEPIKFKTSVNSRFSNTIKNRGQNERFRLTKDYILRLIREERIVITKRRFKTVINLLLKQFKKERFKNKWLVGLVILKMLLNKYTKPRKKTWLMYDRKYSASDNAYHFYKYIRNNKSKEINPVFAITKKGNEVLWNRLKKEGFNMVDNSSLKYWFIRMRAEVIAVSQGHVANIYRRKDRLSHLFRPISPFKVIHLWHGILYDGHALSLNVAIVDFDLWTVAGQPEKDRIYSAKTKYVVGDDIVKVTGLCRYDSLFAKKDKDVKTIVIFPTWRREFTNMSSAQYTNSEYYKFYDSLINNKELNETCKENNWEIKFTLHPQNFLQIDNFKSKFPTVTIDKSCRYDTLLAEADVYVSDRSGTIYDAAYKRIPIIYTRFDGDLLNNHARATAGGNEVEWDKYIYFGPIVHGLDETVNELIKTIKRGGTVKEEYKANYEKVFNYSDANNCQRVYEEIKKIV